MYSVKNESSQSLTGGGEVSERQEHPPDLPPRVPGTTSPSSQQVEYAKNHILAFSLAVEYYHHRSHTVSYMLLYAFFITYNVYMCICVDFNYTILIRWGVSSLHRF